MQKYSSYLTVIGLLMGLLSTLSCVDQSKSDEIKSDSPTGNTKNDFKVIAYYTGPTGEIDNKTVQQLDQIIYSFLYLEGNKLYVDKNKDNTSLAYLTSLRKQNPDLEILVALGGWGGCETCSEVFSSREGRKEFSKSVKDILQQYNLDGIDLDWEYPAVEGYPGHPYKPEDRENFTALVKELRQTIGNDFEISFAAGGFDSFLKDAIEWKEIMPFLDNVNLMSYDLVNGSSDLTGHHTPLYSTPGQSLSADRAIKYLDSIGVPRDKIILGAAFYARVWENVDNPDNGLFQKGKFKEAILYKDLASYQNENKGFEKYWDSTAQAPYLYNSEKGLFATYDDSTSIAEKTKYVIENDLGGIMFWQLSGDFKEEGLVHLIDQVKSGEN